MSTAFGVTDTKYLYSDYHFTDVSISTIQYEVPLTGATVTVGATSHLVLNPAGTLATLTIAFPANPKNGQLFNVTSSQIVTALTVTGATFADAAPADLAVFTPLQYIYSSDSGSWWAV